MTYLEFLKSKEIQSKSSGFKADEKNFPILMFDWQKDIVHWALQKGKAALFEDCGLGKSIQQICWAQEVVRKTGGTVLILAPLAVAQQTVLEGKKFEIKLHLAQSQEDVLSPGIYITNYEKLAHFRAESFTGVVLDESSVLKDYTSATKQELVERFSQTPYKLCCTATPAPNDFVELGNHAEFLGIMSRQEMLATFFVHDGGSTTSWRLKGHAQQKFFEWVSGWACCMTSPEDLGYDAAAYQLPPLNLIEHVAASGDLIDESGQTLLIPQTKQTLSERRTSRRNSLDSRVQIAAEIVNKIGGQCLVWCDLNDESKALTASISGAVEVCGADSPTHKTEAMNGFTSGKVKVLVSKPSIAGFGMNWQNCHEMVFVGLSDSFESYYQAMRRCWRFGQEHPVNVHLVISDAEGAVRANIQRKQADAARMTKELVQYTKDILTAEIHQTVRLTETYIVSKPMMIPSWLGGAAA